MRPVEVCSLFYDCTYFIKHYFLFCIKRKRAILNIYKWVKQCWSNQIGSWVYICRCDVEQEVSTWCEGSDHLSFCVSVSVWVCVCVCLHVLKEAAAGVEQRSSSFGRTKQARCPLQANTSNYITQRVLLQYSVTGVLWAARVTFIYRETLQKIIFLIQK